MSQGLRVKHTNKGTKNKIKANTYKGLALFSFKKG